MTDAEALEYWLGRVDYERNPAQGGDLKLDRMRSLLERIGQPQRRLKILHVAGSKGKGSTAAMLASVLACAGYRTGLFTSPHLSTVHERIRIDGEPIHPAELTSLILRIRPAVNAMADVGEPPTFFEMATALGFQHFADCATDFAVVEVGLGGRFDSTNVCDPLVSIITSISYDHTAILGDQLAAIAFEKCGIIKPGRPVVSGVRHPEARDVIRRISEERGSRLWEVERDFAVEHAPGHVTPQAVDQPAATITTSTGRRHSYRLGLFGAHQARNAALCVETIERLREFGHQVPEPAVARGLLTVSWPARMEVVADSPLLVLDCAHNVASAVALAECLDESFPRGRRTLVFAASADKDASGMLRELSGRFQAFHFTKYLSNPRAVEPETLASIVRNLTEADVFVHGTPAEALQAATRHADLVCVAGSVFLAGEVRALVLGTRRTN